MANIFPKWSNALPVRVVIAALLAGTATVAGITYYLTPKYTRVGYMPTQPVAFDHSLHVSQVGIDCRYCHTFVDRSGYANIPDAGTCMNCHNAILPTSPQLAPIRESHTSGRPVEWVRVHLLPDYVFFNHAVHVNRGVGCVECHGRVDEMQEIYHAEPLSMAFCLECHRQPERFLRDPERIYDLSWEAGNPRLQEERGRERVINWNVHPPESCSGCHR